MPSVVAEVGSTANNYQVLAKLATGGMAEIFLARGASVAGVERYVVLKRILRERATDTHFVQMFLEEARLAAQLNHPNVAQVYDIGKLGDSYFFTMEYVHGETVRALLHRARSLRREIPLGNIFTVIANSAAGLHHAHERIGIDGRPLGIVHRDVSPSNLMISYEGSVKVVDFGVAKAENRANETRSGAVKGKISYLSPEQCRGAPVDRRSDLFSLGIVLWEMLTTERLYRRESDFANMHAIVTEPPPPPSTRRPGLAPEVDAISLRLLAKHPADRFQTADELIEAIEELAARNSAIMSTSALSRFMRELFGQRPEPWVEMEQQAPEGVTVTSEPIPPELIAKLDPVDMSLARVKDLSTQQRDAVSASQSHSHSHGQGMPPLPPGPPSGPPSGPLTAPALPAHARSQLVTAPLAASAVINDDIPTLRAHGPEDLLKTTPRAAPGSVPPGNVPSGPAARGSHPSGAPAMGGPAMGGPAMGGPAMGGPAMGGPAMGGPAMGGPAMGGPAMSGPAMGGPAMGGSAMGGPAMGGPAMGGAPMGGSAMGGPAMGGPAMGGPAMGGPAMGGPAMGGPAMGGPAMGGPSTGTSPGAPPPTAPTMAAAMPSLAPRGSHPSSAPPANARAGHPSSAPPANARAGHPSSAPPANAPRSSHPSLPPPVGPALPRTTTPSTVPPMPTSDSQPSYPVAQQAWLAAPVDHHNAPADQPRSNKVLFAVIGGAMVAGVAIAVVLARGGEPAGSSPQASGATAGSATATAGSATPANATDIGAANTGTTNAGANAATNAGANAATTPGATTTTNPGATTTTNPGATATTTPGATATATPGTNAATNPGATNPTTNTAAPTATSPSPGDAAIAATGTATAPGDAAIAAARVDASAVAVEPGNARTTPRTAAPSDAAVRGVDPVSPFSDGERAPTRTERIDAELAQGHVAAAYRLCNDGVAMTGDRASACTLAACQLGEAAKARAWIGKVATGKRPEIVAACRERGVDPVPPKQTAKPRDAGVVDCHAEPMACQR